jgi:AbrB family looped-hinge helix DNA binding protein
VRKFNFSTVDHQESAAMPLVRIKQKFQVTIPATIRGKLRLEEGELLEASMKGSTIVLTPKAVVNRAEVEAAIAEGLEAKRKGRLTPPFRNAREFRKVRASKEYKALLAQK